MTELRELATTHLQLRLRGLHRALRAAVDRQIELAARFTQKDLEPICITEAEVTHLLNDAEQLLAQVPAAPDAELWSLSDAAPDPQAEVALRSAARQRGLPLPLDVVFDSFGLDPFEQLAILVCAAPLLDRSYERIYAFIVDDLSRRAPSAELLTLLASSRLATRIAFRHQLARFGKLRRCGILVARGDSASEPRLELQLADGLFEYLTGDGNDLRLLCRDTFTTSDSGSAQTPLDRATTSTSDQDRRVICAAPERTAELANRLLKGELRIAGIWAASQSTREEKIHCLAAQLGRPLRRWVPLPLEQGASVLPNLREALQEAAVGGALLWIEADGFSDSVHRDVSTAVASELTRSSVVVLLTASQPWRPPELLAVAAYADVELEPSTVTARKAQWLDEMPELAATEAEEMARRLRLSRLDVRAAVRVARSDTRPLDELHSSEATRPDNTTAYRRLMRATSALAGSRCRQFATLIHPKRGPNDLILPATIHRQVLEVAQFFRAWPTVADTWGFGRLATGEGGVKALFTGDSGTGKTLAAEVIARELHLPLLRVEHSRVVSKWVGETEKNLEATFAEARDCQAVLLFDEADALFGRRGSVESGVDRYANLEVSYLLQRLEDHDGLVILASNLKDNIDNAFTRRFQAILHFPRPEQSERVRIWRMAFPPGAPLDRSIDFDALSNLDLTGAGIVGAARTAALFAAEEGAAEIGKLHIVRAIARQYRREARLLTPVELGPYAGLLRESR